MTMEIPAVTGNPVISIVMPVYNGVRFLPAQLDSILQQTFRDFELIIADDKSTDDSLSLLQAYAQRDGRIRILPSENNVGLARNLENTFQHARAEWIAIADQDDIWHPEKLALLLDNAGSNTAIYCNSELIDDNGDSFGMTIMQALGVDTPASGNNPLMLLWQNCVSGHAMIFRRTLCTHVLPFSDSMPYDHQIVIVAMAKGGLAYLPQTLVQHRLHGENLCNHSLLPKKTDASTESHVRRDKRVRRQYYRVLLIQKLDFFVARGLLPARWTKDRHPQQFDQQWFDIGLFFLILLHPEIYTHGKHKNRLRKALKFSKGGRWYHLENYLHRQPGRT